uniref:Uncharacterized protein n=1 Tax=Pavo cristatus TaxID=9049 RepID=A0A8C9FN13_PAVCR
MWCSLRFVEPFLAIGRSSTVLEIITNQTSVALDLLADQFIQMRNAIFQHLCRTLNESSYYLQIDDNGEVVKQIIKEMRKLAHVPIQMWKGWELDMFSWLPGGPWVKHALFFLLCAATVLIFVPCLIPCFMQLIRHILKGMQITAMNNE